MFFPFYKPSVPGFSMHRFLITDSVSLLVIGLSDYLFLLETVLVIYVF